MPKRWVPRNQLSPNDLERIRQDLGITNDLFVHVLWNRGVRSKEQWEAMINGGSDQIHSPFLMQDMDRAVRRVTEAINSRQKVLVFGDYDVDGTTAVAMMFSFLSEQGVDCEFYIPDRYKEGYGVSKAGIDHAVGGGFSLIIALDCGVRSVDLIRYSNEQGIDFIVCDHHIPGDELPPAIVLNPKRADCKYPFGELSGCGIGFKLIQALVDTWQLDVSAFEKYYDLVAVSIAADLVSMTGENRLLMKLGLQKLMEDPLPGFRLITSSLPENKRLSVSNLVFMIGPRINAAGRMASGMAAVHMMLARNQEDVRALANVLDKYNKERQGIDKETTEQALKLIEDDPAFNDSFTTLVYNENWHKGVVGIVASRLMEKHYRPTIVLTRSGDTITGSARSIEGFNIHDALEECREHLIQFGGHYYAAGMSLQPDKLDSFTTAFEHVAGQTLDRDQLIQKIHYDCEVDIASLTLNVYHSLTKVSPFGPDNPEPMFVSRFLTDTGGSRRIGSDMSHLRLELMDRGSGKIIQAVAFSMGDHIDMVRSGPVDVIYHLSENHFNGRSSLQLDVKDIQRSTS